MDVVDLIRIDAGIAQRVLHAATRAVIARQGDVIRIAGHAEADQLGVDFCTALFGMLEIFEQQHARAIAEHAAVPVLVPRTAGAFPILVARARKSVVSGKSVSVRVALGGSSL